MHTSSAPASTAPPAPLHVDVKPSIYAGYSEVDGIPTHSFSCGNCGMITDFDKFEISFHGGIPNEPNSQFKCKCCGQPIFYSKDYRS